MNLQNEAHLVATFSEESTAELTYLTGPHCPALVTLNGFAVPVPEGARGPTMNSGRTLQRSALKTSASN